MSYFTEKTDKRLFFCPCCGEKGRVSPWLIHLLNKIREGLGKPMYVNSGYRCKKHNEKVGGKENSAHRRGTAADIKCTNSHDRFIIIELAYEVGFKRLKPYPTFIHLDVDVELPQEVMWGD